MHVARIHPGLFWDKILSLMLSIYVIYRDFRVKIWRFRVEISLRFE